MDRNLSIINNFQKKDYNSYPFPYFTIDKPYDDKIYSQLEKDYNLFVSYFQKKEDFKKSNIRLQISSVEFFESNLFKNSIWYDFISYHSSKEFFLKIVDIFYDDIQKIYPSVMNLINENKNKQNFIGLRNKEKNDNFFFVSDCQPGINTPVTDRSTVRDSHIDNPVELIAGLFYLRFPNDNSIGGDLEIMENIKKKEIKFHNKAEVYNKNDLSVFKKIKYKKNNVIFFLNTINSIHRISPRENGLIPRNLTNIIFETYYIKEKLFKINYKKTFLRP